ncbi:metallophosphatase family protein [Zavarzinia compransoris]|uniref:metallophosphoesterase family protein n=1 Tax=Zavarzinia marina TaxID=2911065 RepID=UPI001F2B1124|nr:metallophosphoesterase family protein [Zavarzinia marina]MCF4165624.1 metallophosphatase family protein [Zavarzinia marina]
MQIAFLTDIHSNREALSAVLAHVAARPRPVDRFVLLGDYVGYGADPQWTIDTIADLVDKGAIAIRGNHDEAAIGAAHGMNAMAASAIDWTNRHLDKASLQFLERLPLTAIDDDRLYVHADASAPDRWLYVMDGEAARRSLEAAETRLVFSGHVHIPGIYGLSNIGKLTPFKPVPGIAVPLLAQRRWLALIGSVGQPRDGDPAAAYAVYDTHSAEIAFQRVPYDVDRAAEKIRAAGLPSGLASRLYAGR